MHPLVVKEMKKEIGKMDSRFRGNDKGSVVLDIPLLFEEKLDRLCEKTVVVYAPAALQKKRLKKRNRLSEKEIKNRLKSQMPIEQKKKKADFVIDNSGSLIVTRQQVQNFLRLFH